MARKTPIVILAAFLVSVLAAIVLLSPLSETNSPLSAQPLQSAVPAASSTPSVRLLRVPILIYHSVAPYRADMSPLVKAYTVTPQALEAQLRYLRDNGYTVISFESLVNAMTSSSTTLPHKAVVLTFDDGWEDLYRYAFPLLTQYGVTATFFVFTNGMGHTEFLSWDQLKELQAAGMDIESHSVSHPYLYAITDKKRLWEEIDGSRAIIAAHLGRVPDLFAYPFGKYSDLDIAMLKAAGYRAARTDLGWTAAAPLPAATTTDTLYKLPGVQVTNDFTRFVALVKE